MSRRRRGLVYFTRHAAKRVGNSLRHDRNAVTPNASSPRILSRMSWFLTVQRQCVLKALTPIVDPGPGFRMRRLWRRHQSTRRGHFPLGSPLDTNPSFLLFRVSERFSIKSCRHTVTRPESHTTHRDRHVDWYDNTQSKVKYTSICIARIH